MNTYEDWAKTHESDIRGEEWGADHLWHYESTPSNASIYKCARCFWPFAHYYNSEPDIFKAMKSDGIPQICPRQQLWPIRPEYAGKDEMRQYEELRLKVSVEITL